VLKAQWALAQWEQAAVQALAVVQIQIAVRTLTVAQALMQAPTHRYQTVQHQSQQVFLQQPMTKAQIQTTAKVQIKITAKIKTIIKAQMTAKILTTPKPLTHQNNQTATPHSP
jgi:hypothetical protein